MRFISKILLLIFSISGFFLLIHGLTIIKKIDAVVFSTSPADPTEDHPKVTIRITELGKENTEYGVCLTDECVGQMREGRNDSFLDKKIRSEGNVLTFDVCGKGEDDLKTNCDDGDFFHAEFGDYEIGIYELDALKDPLVREDLNIGHHIPTITMTQDTYKNTDNATIKICNRRHPDNDEARNAIDFDITGPGVSDPDDLKLSGDCTDYQIITGLNGGTYTVKVRWDHEDFTLATITIPVSAAGGKPYSIIYGVNEETVSRDSINPNFDPSCDETGTCPTQFETPLGTIPANVSGFATFILSLGIGIAGGVAFLLMIFGSYRLMFAGGNPEAVQQGREVITAAIAGLVVIIFAVFILRFIGFTIFGLGGF